MSQCIMIRCCNLAKLYWKTKHAIGGCGSTKKIMLFSLNWMENGLYFTSKEWYWVFSLNYQLPIVSWLGMGGGSLKGGSQDVAKPTINFQLKMEDVYIFWKLMEILWWRKITKMEIGSPLSPLITQATLAHSCEKMSICLWKQL
jgi:hypothetical protein